MTTQRRYAADTSVTVAKSKAEIEATLQRYGATGFGYMTQGRTNAVMFEIANRRVIMRLVIPEENDAEIAITAAGKRRTASQRAGALTQVEKQRWRALLLTIKAKLESVASGIETVEEAFLAHIALPSGQTVGEWAGPQVAETYESGRMPPMIPKFTVTVSELPERIDR